MKAGPIPSGIVDAADELARRGFTAEDIRSTMVTWALQAAEDAARWAEEEDRRLSAEIAQEKLRLKAVR